MIDSVIPRRGVRCKRGQCEIRYKVDGEQYSQVLPIPWSQDGVEQAALERHRRIQALKAGIPPVEGDSISYAAAFAAARKRGGQLTAADEQHLIERADGRCELTDISFSMIRVGYRSPYAPSIDRINSSLPYSRDNCRLVCIAVNLALNEWGEQVFRHIVAGYVKRKLTW